ncbi:hypothetical protein [Prosthecobacter sp.]|uniref:hypothetical protein n=1 Tax=Prosthecobacter sp. TaxID=1965333 RepID=UPI003783BCA9
MITAQPSHRAPAQQVHGNSMHPKVRAVLDRGLGAEWTLGEVEELLGVSRRSAQYLFDSHLLAITRYPAKAASGRTIRSTLGLSLLVYLIKYSDEFTEADAQPIIKKVLPLLTNQILEGIIGACKALINARSSLLVAVKPAPEKPQQEPKPAARPKADPYAGMPDLFPAHDAGAPKTTTP